MTAATRSTTTRLLAPVLALGLLLSLGACSKDNDKKASTNQTTTTASASVTTTSAADLPSDDAATKYCTTVKETQKAIDKGADRVETLKKALENTPATIKPALQAVIDMIANPNDAAKKVAGTKAFAQVIQYNQNVCGITTNLSN